MVKRNGINTIKKTNNSGSIRINTIRDAIKPTAIRNKENTDIISTGAITNGETASLFGSAADENYQKHISSGNMTGRIASEETTDSEIPGTNATGIAALCTALITNAPAEINSKPINPTNMKKSLKRQVVHLQI